MSTNMDRWHRADVVEAAMHAYAVETNPERADWLRAQARKVFDMTKQVLLYQNDPHKPMVFVPASFGVKDFYQNLVVELLGRLPQDIKDDNPVYVTAAKHFATLVDNTSYSTDFRAECHEALMDAVDVLEYLASDDDEPRLEVVK